MDQTTLKEFTEKYGTRYTADEMRNKAIAKEISKALVNIPSLNECTAISVISACNIITELELTINDKLDYAQLLPIKNQCELYITSKGVMQILSRHKEVKAITLFKYGQGKESGTGATIELFNGYQKTLKQSNQEIKKEIDANKQREMKYFSFEDMAKKHVLIKLVEQTPLFS